VLGRFLFRWRGVIGFVAFGVVFWLARPTLGSCLFGPPIILAGLAIRFWASGYIGIEGRVREIGGQREERGVRREGREARSEEREVKTEARRGRREEDGGQRRRIVSGPYRTLRHPLYIGNFLLVAGMLVALRPAWWLGTVVLAGFIVEYGMIVAAEERHLAGRRSQRLEARGESAEVQSGRGRMARGEWRGAIGESFLLSRALVEWRTWVVTGFALGLAMAKALLVRG
jgi:hypothetical protein